MASSIRIDTAITKLYQAFHNNMLDPECCSQCAVGTLLDGTTSWQHLSDYHGSLQLNYVGSVHQNLGRRFNGYTPQELLHIEASFLRGCGYKVPLTHTLNTSNKCLNEEQLFEGLCATINMLYHLEGMDITQAIPKICIASELVVPKKPPLKTPATL